MSNFDINKINIGDLKKSTNDGKMIILSNDVKLILNKSIILFNYMLQLDKISEVIL